MIGGKERSRMAEKKDEMEGGGEGDKRKEREICINELEKEGVTTGGRQRSRQMREGGSR